MMTRYVILGMGAAGIAAAETIRQIDPGGEIVCVSAEQAGYYSRPGLAYYLSKELGEKALYPFSKRDFQDQNFRVYKNTAVKVDTANWEVIFRDQKRLKYDRLLLAVGAQAVRPKVEGVDLDGVVYLDSMAQTQRMIKKARWVRQAVVVGGGITALEIVEGLQARRVQAHFFLRGEQYWGRVLDSIESQIVLNRLKHEGVIIHQYTELERIFEKKGKVAAVLTKDGRKIKAGMVAFAIGVRPRTELAVASGLEVGRGVRVNEYMEASVEGVYAAGDAAEIHDPAPGEWIVDSLWHVARHQGMVAGMNMAGEPQAYQRRSPLNVTRLAGLTTTIIGKVGMGGSKEDDFSIVRGESETWQQLPDAVVCQNNFEVNRLRVMVGEKTLLGAVLMGDQSLSQALEELVANQADVSPIRSQLLEKRDDLGSILLRFWTDWRKTHAN
jgi:NAD(P)H-nitrite reductase large subunit